MEEYPNAFIEYLESLEYDCGHAPSLISSVDAEEEVEHLQVAMDDRYYA